MTRNTRYGFVFFIESHYKRRRIRDMVLIVQGNLMMTVKNCCQLQIMLVMLAHVQRNPLMNLVNEFEEGKITENIPLQDTFDDSAYDTFHHDDFSEPRKKDRREVEIELHVDLVHDYFAP
ncbi:hypothetical protein HanRHA438_Chr06g0286091 [Helianthus annuus]|nr:hypothetical protein HanHA300_Chr06g0227201 [Helianthus annuus]KAJ0568585.1 hypothetical protein HanIR_Chr06g0297851 [Helianthus annuus]KAJ0574872.1 hypothetical protein HanHA89_Chr06g0243171 [Helianthus annuus]KAJ0739202.1 hypothetical protein HanLR1_Chr06g0227221 [Helianthus annuus]KAJ0742053.1 hypothetical protein HanOQP8_Chr06g0235161 [Helianthus annuus]